MPAEQHQNSTGTMSLDDVYYTLFRHKWKILVCSLGGVAAAAFLYLTTPTPYASEAKLLVRYVVENRSLAAASTGPQNQEDSRVVSPDSGGESIINSELAILTSSDLLSQVAEDVGVEKMLARFGGGNDRTALARLIQEGLKVEVPRRSAIIVVGFQHPDPEIPQQFLRKLVDRYFLKHQAVHRADGIFDDFLTKETDRLRSQLATTEAELQKLRTNAGMLSIEDARRAYVTEMSQIRQEIVNAEAELALRQSSIKQMEQATAPAPGATNQTLAISADKVSEYRNLNARLESLRNRRNELLLQFTEENAMVKVIQQQLAEAEHQRSELVRQYPALAAAPSSPDRSTAVMLSPLDELNQVSALQARITVLSNRLDNVRSEAGGMEEAQARVVQLQRQRDLEEANYRYYSAKLEQARIDETLGAGKISNISEVQAPLTARPERRGLMKPLAMCLVGGVGLGIALAFLMEMFLDPTVRRPSELVGKLRMPLLLSIPTIQPNGDSTSPSKGSRVPATEQSLVSAILADTPGKRTPTEIAAWDAGHHLHPYHQALRDRLMTYFEVNNLTHKPKLVAVTGCSAGSGVTTLAAGLAATLSDTGEGKVLLVDMNQEQGSAHPFFKGRPALNLIDSLEQEKRASAMIQDRLYMAAENPRERLPSVLPSRFSSLVPKLKASDYDYIIFDMPSVSPTSVTPRLARFMDLILLVVESEKTNRHQLKQASGLLVESKANVQAVLNKRRAYVPRWLQPDL